MKNFIDLRKHQWDGPPSDFAELQRRIKFENDYATSQFSVIVGESSLHLWRVGDPTSEGGLRFLIGIADWSLTDLAQ
jgi:hypothetical protein